MSTAFALTMAAGLVGCTDLEPEVVTETVTETVTEEVEVEVEVEPEDLQEQRDAADERDEELDAREAELEEWDEELEELDEALAAREQQVEADAEAAESEGETEPEPDDGDEAEAGGSTIPGDGVYMVGSDVEPGTYATQPGSWGCYWARLSGTSGEFQDIITNGFVDDGQALVTIAETDVAFETSGCGTWEKQ